MDYASTHGQLKLLNEAHMPDPRWQNFFTHPLTGIEWLHRRITPMQLHAGVPKGVQTQFETARNLLLHTWFVFEFQTVAEMQAFAALEHALRLRLAIPDKDRLGLSKLLKMALDKGLLLKARDATYARMMERQHEQEAGSQPPSVAPPDNWFQQVLSSIPDSRNYLAHGGPKLYLYEAILHLELCADMINLLFEVPAWTQSTPAKADSVVTS